MLYRSSFLIIILFALIYSNAAFSETNGTLNFSTRNVSVTTGLFGYTVSTCSSNSGCFGYACFFDYDTAGHNTTTSGTCAPTTFTSCIHDTSSGVTTIVAGGSYICASNTTTRQCSSGSWASEVSCSSGQSCTVGAVSTSSPCSTSGTTGSTTSTSSTTNTTNTTKIGMINITSVPGALEVIQGNSTSGNVTIKNIGNATLANITLSVSGIESSWYSVLPTKVTSLIVGNSSTFSIAFSIPQAAGVKSYTVVFTVAAPGVSSKSASIALKILPSANTIAQINQTFENYTSLYTAAEKNVTDLEKTNVNTEDLGNLKSILNDIKNKLIQANESIAKGDYFTAQQAMDEANNLINTLNEKIGQVRYQTPAVVPGGDNTIIFIIAGVVIAVVAIIIYLFWPTKKEKIAFDIFRK